MAANRSQLLDARFHLNRFNVSCRAHLVAGDEAGTDRPPDHAHRVIVQALTDLAALTRPFLPAPRPLTAAWRTLNASLISTSEERASLLDPKLASSVQNGTVKWVYASPEEIS